MADRCLVVANQTIGGTDLDAAVRDRVAHGTRRFHVIVPMTAVEHEATAWTGGLYLAGDELSAFAALAFEGDEADRRFREERDEARRRAAARMAAMIDRIAVAGGEATGEVGSADPLEAVRQVLERQPPFAHIIVSTLPRGLSRWLRQDLPSRIASLADTPMTIIEAEADQFATSAASNGEADATGDHDGSADDATS
ncbi:MAG: hypothetical protein WD377_08840 [Nitriliruptoraceae bacterium]